MTPADSLSDHVAVVVGGAGDIGSGVATSLIDAGSRVVLVDRDRSALDERAARLGATATVDCVVADVADPDQCDRVVAEAADSHGRIDALVNAAMVTRRGSVDSITPDDWHRLIAVNLSAVFFTCRSAIPVMRRQGGGVIVNMGSMSALRAMPSSPAYAAAKGGVVSLSRALAIDHASDGIRVFSVNPPAVDTRLFAATFAHEPDPVAARRAYEAQQPGGRVLTVDEIVATVMHLIGGAGPPWTEEPLIV